jgi:hypothetical protein
MLFVLDRFKYDGTWGMSFMRISLNSGSSDCFKRILDLSVFSGVLNHLICLMDSQPQSLTFTRLKDLLLDPLA